MKPVKSSLLILISLSLPFLLLTPSVLWFSGDVSRPHLSPMTYGLSVSSAGNTTEVNHTESEVKDECGHLRATNEVLNEYGQVNLFPGELPGYTGWFRPGVTLSGFFEITGTSSNSCVKVGSEWYVDVKCEHSDCKVGRSQFYTRAYGPTIVTGRVKNHGDGSYRISFSLQDPGSFTVEVVLTFSNPDDWRSFPLNHEDPNYEGYMLPGFPLQLTVSPNDLTTEHKNKKTLPFCSKEQLVEKNSTSAYDKARWVVLDSVRTRHSRPSSHAKITLDGYRLGINSLGIDTAYKYIDCNLLSRSRHIMPDKKDHLFDRCIADTKTKESFHFIFIGDSVMFLEVDYFSNLLKNSIAAKQSRVNVTTISTQGALVKTIHQIKAELNDIKTQAPNEKRVIYFNAGLHDLNIYCNFDFENVRNETDAVKWGKNYACVDKYRELLSELVNFVGTYPAEFRVFRSTTAGWMRYGNFGFVWKKQNQAFPSSTHFVAKMNEIAFDVVQTSNHDIQIIDGFWLTLPRPDNTQVSSMENKPGAHLVHPGEAVVSVMGNKLFSLLMTHFCSDLINSTDI